MGERGKTTRDGAGTSMAVRNCHLPPPLLGFAAGAPLKGRPFSHAEQERQRDLKVCWEPKHRAWPPIASPAPPRSELPPSEKGSGRQEWFCDSRDHRRSFWLLLPSPEKFAVDPPEFLAVAGAVAAAGSKSELLRVVIPCCDGCCERDWELRF
ncbi:uncharacterized protein LOC110262757 [Arachis ipaensis]|uniref:uncharacterized protein LOC110262757 n=1 Tax=Arachis ipaensis TaxID=130454 RepID=UPI000A2AF0B3|nr:uncharacterized protein LOC110262757 [Arachis ipaensis]XP_025650804.1 uncharacterized protein LOC112746905 [Arachis hypogaea]